jgi:hypothetical protein
LEARTDDDRLGGRNDTPHASARGCCRGFLIKPRANLDFSAQALERVQTILAHRDRLPHPWGVRAQEPVKLAYKKGIGSGIMFWRWDFGSPGTPDGRPGRPRSGLA